jgi:hypothetical protein
VRSTFQVNYIPNTVPHPVPLYPSEYHASILIQ